MYATPDVVRRNSDSPVNKTDQEFTATIANVIAVGLGQYLKELGLDGTPVLQAAGLKPEALSERYSRFPVQQLAVALQIAAQLEDDPYFGLHFGERYRPPILLACNYAISTAPNLRKALISLQDHRNLVAKIPTRFCDFGAFVEFSWTIEVASASPRHLIDFKAMRTLKHIQQATGTDWRPLRVNLAYEKPDNMSEYTRLLGPNIHFRQTVNSFRIEPAALAIPMPDADPDIYHMACSSLKNPFAYEQDDTDPVDRLRRFISSQLGKNGVSLASASKHMGMTPQQLRRLLKKQKTCFQCILDITRKCHAAHYLCETDTRFSEVAFLLGFSDQSALSRAVNRWYGIPPKELRRGSTG